MTEPRTLAPFGRRTVEVVGSESVGAYVVLTAADPDDPTPQTPKSLRNVMPKVRGWFTR